MVEHALEERGVVSPILTSGTRKMFQDFLQTQSWPNFSNFLSWDYWTSQNLNSQPSDLLFGLIVTVIIVIVLLFWWLRLRTIQKRIPVYDAPINNLSNLIIFMIVLSASYVFFRTQEITYVSSRLFVLSVDVIALVWFIWISYYVLKIVPSKRRHYLERERFFRYLPRIKEKKR